MKKKTSFVLLAAVAITSAGCLYGYNYLKDKKDNYIINKYRKEGEELVKENNYAEAINKFMHALNISENKSQTHKKIMERIAETFYKMEDYASSITYTDKLLEINKRDGESVRRKFLCLKKLNKGVEALKELYVSIFLANSKEKKTEYEKEKNPYFEEVLNNIIKERMDNKEIFPTKNSLDNFFNTFPLINKELETMGSLKEIYFSKNEDKKTNFVKGCIEHIKGNKEEAIKLLEKAGTIYSKILKEYINSENKDYVVSSEFEQILRENEEDPSVLFYGAVIFLEIDESKYKSLLEKGLTQKYSVIFSMLKIVELLKKTKTRENFDEIKEIIESEKQKENSVKEILRLLIDHFISSKQIKAAGNYLETLNEFYPSDYFYFLNKARISVIQKDGKAEEYFVKTIEKDSETFEGFYRYGCYLFSENDKRFVGCFEKAYFYSSNYKEAALSFKILLLYEINSMILEEYPEFEN